MKLKLPKSDWPLICLDVDSPEGAFQMTLSDVHTMIDINLPDNVLEDEVEVSAMWVDAGNKAVSKVMVLKEAVKPESKGKDDEDAPVKTDKKATKNPPTESDHEEADKEVKPVNLSKKTRRRRS